MSLWGYLLAGLIAIVCFVLFIFFLLWFLAGQTIREKEDTKLCFCKHTKKIHRNNFDFLSKCKMKNCNCKKFVKNG